MRFVGRAVGVLGLGAVLAGPLGAQDTRELFFQVNGGGLRSLSTLDRGGIYDTKTGAGFSGSLGVKIVNRLAVRADLSYAKTAIRFSGAEFGADFDRVFASLVAQLQFPSENGLNPYVLAGGGAAFLNQHATVDPKKTVGHFVGGTGLAYRIGKTGLSVLGETRVFLHQPRGLLGNALSDQRVQWDLFFGFGVSYAFTIGTQ